MLNLLTPTSPTWVDAVEKNLGRLLVDHAHCELKAAQSALSLVGRFGGEHPDMVAPLVALAQEETEHFHQVHRQAQARGYKVEPPEPDPYVLALRKCASPEAQQVPRLMDRLLLSAMIEARSCERFKLLSERLSSSELRHFYRELMESEARHYVLFSSLSESLFGRDESKRRFVQLAEREAAIADQLPLCATVHG